MHTINEKKLLMLKPFEIDIPETVKRASIDEYGLRLLADSITANGIITPIAVRKNGYGRYELISGYRRLKAAQLIGLRRLPCILHRTDSTTAACFYVAENLQRCNPSVFEQAAIIKRLLNNYSLSEAELCARLGLSQATLIRYLELLKLSVPIREKIQDAGFNEDFCSCILKLPEHLRDDAVDKIISDGLTLKQTHDYINNLLYPKRERAESEKESLPTRKTAIGDTRLFGNSLSKLIETVRNSGIDASLRKLENDKYVEYKIRIKKETPQHATATQLKIC